MDGIFFNSQRQKNAALTNTRVHVDWRLTGSRLTLGPHLTLTVFAKLDHEYDASLLLREQFFACSKEDLDREEKNSVRRWSTGRHFQIV